jgi:hypothetical protein
MYREQRKWDILMKLSGMVKPVMLQTDKSTTTLKAVMLYVAEIIGVAWKANLTTYKGLT